MAELGGDAEMRGTTKSEILHNKVQEMRGMSREPQEAEMKQRTCAWEGCNADITGTPPRTLYCMEHKEPAAKRAQAAYRKRTAAGEKPKKPKSVCEKCMREDCDDRGRREKCAKFTLNKERAIPPVPEPSEREKITVEKPEADPRPAPEGHGPPGSFHPISRIEPVATRQAAVDVIRQEQDGIFASRDKTRGTHRLNTLTCAVIIGDKAERLINQWKLDRPMDPEEWLDIANYAIIALLLERGQWQLPWRMDEESDAA